MSILSNKRLLVGIVCGVLAAIFMLIYISDVRAQAMSTREDAIIKYGGETVAVCVAVRDLVAGEVVTSSDIELQTWLVDLLPEEAVTDPNDIIGSTVNTQILANEPISLLKLGRSEVALTVPEGLSAISIESEDVLAVGGAIESGSTVDVYSVTDSGVVLLGEDILVLETSNSTNASGSNSSSTFGDGRSRGSISWITLAVTPESIEQLISASKTGELYFSLPSSSHDSLVEQEGATQ